MHFFQICNNTKEVRNNKRYCAGIYKYQDQRNVRNMNTASAYMYRVIQKDGLNFVRLYFLNYTWYVNDLHNI